ncbi:MAG: CCA tRNA nucleotidyltransferase [Desulfobacteraceae bacterium]
MKETIRTGQGARFRFSKAVPGFVRWMITTLECEGFSGLIVGGAVRDMCMGREAEDWDLITDAPASAVKAIFSHLPCFQLHPDTVSLVLEGRTCHINTLKEGGGFREDLARRDFTINAMAYEPGSGRLMDLFGGLKDIERRLVRATGSPARRFDEDPLRLMRAVRFASTLGLDIESKTLEEIKRRSGAINRSAPERVRDELMHILLAPAPSRGLRLMQRTGLLREVLPEIAAGHLKRQNSYHRYTILRHTLETVDRVEPTAELRLAALLHDSAKPMVRKRYEKGWQFVGHEEAGAGLSKEILGRLRFSREVTAKVVHLVRHHMIGYSQQWSDAAVRRWIRRVGPGNVEAVLALRRADLEAHGRPDAGQSLLSELAGRVEGMKRDPISRGDLAVDGRTVMAVTGLQPGPEVGRILDRLLETVSEHPELNTKPALIRLIEEERHEWIG